MGLCRTVLVSGSATYVVSECLGSIFAMSGKTSLTLKLWFNFKILQDLEFPKAVLHSLFGNTITAAEEEQDLVT